jgi:hypothetical protein
VRFVRWCAGGPKPPSAPYPGTSSGTTTPFETASTSAAPPEPANDKHDIDEVEEKRERPSIDLFKAIFETEASDDDDDEDVPPRRVEVASNSSDPATATAEISANAPGVGSPLMIRFSRKHDCTG